MPSTTDLYVFFPLLGVFAVLSAVALPYALWKLVRWEWEVRRVRALVKGEEPGELSRMRHGTIVAVATILLWGMAAVGIADESDLLWIPAVVGTVAGYLLLLWALLKLLRRRLPGAVRPLLRLLASLPGLARSPRLWGGVGGVALAGGMAFLAFLPFALMTGYGDRLDELRRERLALVGARSFGSPFGVVSEPELSRTRGWIEAREPSLVRDALTDLARRFGDSPAEWGLPTPEGPVREEAARQAARRVYLEAVARRVEERLREEVGEDEGVDMLLLLDAWRLEQDRVEPRLLWTLPDGGGRGSMELRSLRDEAPTVPGRIFVDRALIAEARRSVQGMADEPQMLAFLWAIGRGGMDAPALHPPPPFTVPLSLPGAFRREILDTLRADTAASAGPVVPPWLQRLTGIPVPEDPVVRGLLLEEYESMREEIFTLFAEVEVVTYQPRALMEGIRSVQRPPAREDGRPPSILWTGASFIDETATPFVAEVLREMGDSAALQVLGSFPPGIAAEEARLATALEAALAATTPEERTRGVREARVVLEALAGGVETWASELGGIGDVYTVLVGSFDETLETLETAEVVPAPTPTPERGGAPTALRRMESVGGPGGVPFEDTCGEVAEIRIRAGWWIDAIQLVCAEEEGRTHPRRGGEGGELNTFTLRPGERVTAVSGTALGPRSAVYAIRIHTDQRQSELYGDLGTTPAQRGRQRFRFQIPEDARLAGFHGASSGQLDRLGLIVAREQGPADGGTLPSAGPGGDTVPAQVGQAAAVARLSEAFDTWCSQTEPILARRPFDPRGSAVLSEAAFERLATLTEELAGELGTVGADGTVTGGRYAAGGWVDAAQGVLRFVRAVERLQASSYGRVSVAVELLDGQRIDLLTGSDVVRRTLASRQGTAEWTVGDPAGLRTSEREIRAEGYLALFDVLGQGDVLGKGPTIELRFGGTRSRWTFPSDVELLLPPLIQGLGCT